MPFSTNDKTLYDRKICSAVKPQDLKLSQGYGTEVRRIAKHKPQ
jgi:hypothetical protein